MTDALSVLEALNSGGEPELTDSLKSLAETYRIAIQWIPAHCGIPGNEAADRLAKEGAKGVQIEQDLNYHNKRTIIKSNVRKTPNANDYHTHITKLFGDRKELEKTAKYIRSAKIRILLNL